MDRSSATVTREIVAEHTWSVVGKPEQYKVQLMYMDTHHNVCLYLFFVDDVNYGPVMIAGVPKLDTIKELHEQLERRYKLQKGDYEHAYQQLKQQKKSPSLGEPCIGDPISS